MRVFFVVFALTGLLMACSSTNPVEEPVDYIYGVRDGQLVDAAGHVLFLRGINVREDAKRHEDHLIPTTINDRIELKAAGINSVRLLTHWQAIMPEEDVLDAVYLDAFAAEFLRLADDGFWIVIDMHQDLWGEPFGDGGADWTCPAELKAGYEPTTPWWTNYTSEQVRACYDNFWETAALQQKWIDAWVAVAAKVCPNERLLGFDLFNEPFPGAGLADLSWDAEVLYPFYQRTMTAIEAVCPGRVFFLEPSMNHTLGQSAPMQVATEDAKRVVFSPHFYPSSVHEPGESYTDTKEELNTALSRALGDYASSSQPLWLGEYGGLTTNDGFADYADQIGSILFERGLGSAIWAFNKNDGGFSFLDASGDMKSVFERSYALPVPSRLPSSPTKVEPNLDAGSLYLEFACKPNMQAEFMLPGSGTWTFDIQPEGALSVAGQDGRRLTLDCVGTSDATMDIRPK
ncbi:MAG: cellulase family glycosylhydrolase [Deltaproteobacteria bacterium]|nr:cellulase family glycosylhydrolase [Deltaproteobacteria bacterium]